MLELIEFILEMKDKTRSIQLRDGFSAGVIEASDRVLEMETKDRFHEYFGIDCRSRNPTPAFPFPSGLVRTVRDARPETDLGRFHRARISRSPPAGPIG